MLPNDPMVLASVINTRLRDGDGDLDELCQSLDIARDELEARLADAGFQYRADIRQFRQGSAG